jgi:hypothetical protein
MLRHRNTESEPTNSNSKSIDEGPFIIKPEHASHAMNEKLQLPELNSSSLKIDPDDTKSSIDHSDSGMEISENGASEMSDHSENFDTTLATGQCRGETERSNNGVVEAKLIMNGERVKGEEGREERVCEGEGDGGEIMAVNEEHMEIMTEDEEECGGELQAGGCRQPPLPGFGKHRGGSVVYTDQKSRQHTV